MPNNYYNKMLLVVTSYKDSIVAILLIQTSIIRIQLQNTIISCLNENKVNIIITIAMPIVLT